tara:strand:- start:78 stop:929 length:852 start_codon:yes stop_codon:yes gene_type:complete
MNDELRILRIKILAMTDNELIEVVYKKPDEYTDEAKKIANDEIEKRGIRKDKIEELINEHHLADNKQFIYKDISSLYNTLILLLKATILISLVAAISSMLEVKLINDMTTGNFDNSTIEDQANINDLRQQLIGIIQFSLFIITSIVFLRWIYFSNSNSRSLGASGMQFTPGWSIGYYFVPFLNFYKPYKAMKEIWKTSKDPKNWEMIKTPSLFPQWWTLWIISSISANISFRLSMRAEELNELFVSSSVTLASDLVGIPLALIAIKLVGSIFDMQNEKHITPT